MTDLKENNVGQGWCYKDGEEVYSTMSERPGFYVIYNNGKFNAYEYRDGSEPDLIGIYDTKEEAIKKIESLT